MAILSGVFALVRAFHAFRRFPNTVGAGVGTLVVLVPLAAVRVLRSVVRGLLFFCLLSLLFFCLPLGAFICYSGGDEAESVLVLEEHQHLVLLERAQSDSVAAVLESQLYAQWEKLVYM